MTPHIGAAAVFPQEEKKQFSLNGEQTELALGENVIRKYTP